MRNNNQNKRMRGGRGNNNNNNNNMNRNKGQNPLTRVYESNGPDLKIRGTPSTIAEKYIQLARDAQSSGDPVAAENYYQHAEHYYRLIAAAQEHFRQNNPQQFYRENEARGAADDNFDDGDEPRMGGQNNADMNYGEREPQPYMPRDAQPYQQPREQQHQPREHYPRPQQQYAPRSQPQPPQPQGMPGDGNDIGGLPSFITGGAPQPAVSDEPANGTPIGENGYDANQPDRFPLHRRRRRHRGPRPDLPAAAQGEPVAEGD